MKKIFFGTFSLMVTAFTYQGCAPADNSKAMVRADSMAEARITASRDSLKMACMNEVLAAAMLRADSMTQMASMNKTSSNHGKKPVPPPAKPGVNTRPGSQQEMPKSVTDRKGTIDSAHGPKKVTDRKGATTVPPKM